CLAGSLNPASGNSAVVNYFAADDGQQRADVNDLFFWNRKKIAIQYHDVRVIARFNRTQFVVPDEPFIQTGRQPERFFACEVLVAEDLLSREILAAGDRV